MFRGVEGARAWLAWIVVASHVVLLSPLYRISKLHVVNTMGDWSVLMFIIISGFVITHLLMTKREGYGAYIMRRSLRIYPAYLVALAIGLLTLPLLPSLVSAADLSPIEIVHLRDQVTGFARHPVEHVLLHLTLMHGLLSNRLLPEAGYIFLAPSWSLSLEWQFYLVAPLFVAGAKRFPAIAAIIVAAVYILYMRGHLGSFTSPSALWGACWLFLIGIATRLCIDKLPTFDRYPFALIIGLAPLAIYSGSLVPIVAWIALVCYMRSEANWAALDGRLAQYWGARSYSIYIVHFPILLCVAWLSFIRLGLTGWAATAAVGTIGTVLTVAVGVTVYRFVEKPAIRLGKKLGREPGPASQGW